LAEKGNHGAACIACARVVDDRFEAVANFDAVLAIVGREQEQNPGIVFFCADTEMFEDIDGVVFYRTIVERPDGNDGELRARFLLQFGAQ
jgi:hypothetical protein